RQRHYSHGAPAGVRGRGAHHHVPRHRVHRGACALRVRARVHHHGIGVPMRMRMLLAASLLAAAALFFVPGTASAQTNPSETTSSESFANSAAEECAKLLNEGKKIDDCQKAPSPILPAKNELIWGTISFVALFILLWKFAWPGLKKGMDTRTERIR